MAAASTLMDHTSKKTIILITQDRRQAALSSGLKSIALRLIVFIVQVLSGLWIYLPQWGSEYQTFKLLTHLNYRPYHSGQALACLIFPSLFKIRLLKYQFISPVFRSWLEHQTFNPVFRPPFKYWTIRLSDQYHPFEYHTGLLLESLSYQSYSKFLYR